MPRRNYFPFAMFGQGSGGPVAKLSSGADGDLVILNGQTVQINAGVIKSYNSIDIQTGGTLQIIGAEAWTQIACRNTFILDGQIVGFTSEDATTYTLPADNWLAGLYSHTVLQTNGGAGGNAQDATNYGIGYGGAQSGGHGGGGGGQAGSSCQASGNGGNGVSNGANGGYEDVDTTTCSVGTGGSSGGTGNQGGHGSPGQRAVGSLTSLAACIPLGHGGSGGGGGGGASGIYNFKGSWTVFGSGAGGGHRGSHGRHVFILAEEGITGSGTIDMDGENGFSGGGAPSGGTSAGGGGGGGAGGSAGKVAIRYPSGKPLTPSISTNGGSGGSSSPSGYANLGSGGSNGFNTLVNDIGTY